MSFKVDSEYDSENKYGELRIDSILKEQGWDVNNRIQMLIITTRQFIFSVKTIISFINIIRYELSNTASIIATHSTRRFPYSEYITIHNYRILLIKGYYAKLQR